MLFTTETVPLCFKSIADIVSSSGVSSSKYTAVFITLVKPIANIVGYVTLYVFPNTQLVQLW